MRSIKLGRGFVLKDGKLVKTTAARDVSARIREKKRPKRKWKSCGL